MTLFMSMRNQPKPSPTLIMLLALLAAFALWFNWKKAHWEKYLFMIVLTLSIIVAGFALCTGESGEKSVTLRFIQKNRKVNYFPLSADMVRLTPIVAKDFMNSMHTSNLSSSFSILSRPFP